MQDDTSPMMSPSKDPLVAFKKSPQEAVVLPQSQEACADVIRRVASQGNKGLRSSGGNDKGKGLGEAHNHKDVFQKKLFGLCFYKDLKNKGCSLPGFGERKLFANHK